MPTVARIVAAVLVVLAMAPVSGAATPSRPVVLHPKWRLVDRSGVASVLVSGRYVYIGRYTRAPVGSATLIDEQTGRRVSVTPPTGCYFDQNAPALGGSWLVATCNPPPPGPRYLFQLYNIRTRTWTPFAPDVKQMFAFNSDCKSGDPECSASYFAVGDQWIEFEITCGYRCGPTTFAFQHLRTGQVRDQPSGWKPGGTEIPDLNSPTLTRVLCKPLRVPAGFTDPTTQQTFPGTLQFHGQFAIAQRWSAYNVNLYTYLERCRSRLRRPIGQPFTANTHLVLWMTAGPAGPHRRLDGVFLPTLRRMRLTLPATPYLAALSTKHVYVITPTGRLYQAKAPAPPKR